MTKIAPDNQCLGLTKANRQCGNNVETHTADEQPRLTCHLHPEFEEILQEYYAIKNHNIVYHKEFHSKYFKEEWDANLKNSSGPLDINFIQKLAKTWFLHAGAISVLAAFSNWITLRFHGFSYFKYATVTDHTARAFQFGGFIVLICLSIMLMRLLLWLHKNGDILKYLDISDYFENFSKATISVSYTHLTLPTIYSV